MQDFLTPTTSHLRVGQLNQLRQYLTDITAGRVSADPTDIQAALDAVGTLLALPGGDLTDPQVYNTTLQTLLANIAGIYQEIDRIEAAQNALADLNGTELDRFELGVRDLQTVLTSTQNANLANTGWTDVFYGTFGAAVERETDSSWYQPVPILNTGDQIESFLPLFIDPEDRSLKLQPEGDFSRSVNAQGKPLAQVTLDELLGLSIDRSHGVDQVIGGDSRTYWQELILSPAPIDADPLQVPWLPQTYNGGAAARVHFRFPFAVPFSEVLIRPFARYPLHVLQAVWDNRNIPVSNLLVNGQFASGGTGWVSGGVQGTGFSFPATGGYQNRSFAQITAVSGRATLATANLPLSGSNVAYHLVLKAQRTANLNLRLLVSWSNSSGGLVRADWDYPALPVSQWTEYDKLFIAPSGTVLGSLASVTLVADGSGTIQFTDVSFSPCLGELTTDIQGNLEADSLSLPLDAATGTDVWLVVAQPHYEFLQITLPAGDLDQQALWEQVRLTAAAQGTATLPAPAGAWQLAGGMPSLPPIPLPDTETNLLKEVKRLGGRVRDMVVNMYRTAQPSTAPQTLNRYLYVLGAGEISIRHREYVPAGLFVSLPYQPRGEVREVTLSTTPALSQLPARLRFWLTARAADRGDKAQAFTGRATFASATETIANPADCHFSLAPVSLRETFNGTDRESRVALAQVPYVNRTAVWMVSRSLSSGAVASPVVYDPNRDTYLLFPAAGASLVAVPGYRPLRASLTFPDGTTAPPDSLGRVQAGDIGLAGPEVLTPATVAGVLNQQVTTTAPALKPVVDPVFGIPLPRNVKSNLRTTSQSTTTTASAWQTAHNPIIAGPNGTALSLYWHKSREDVVGLSTVTSGDVLVSSAKYSIDTANGVITVRDTPPGGNTQYDSFVAYYYYQQGEDGARAALDARPVATLPTAGIDTGGVLTQGFPVTRNMTDYVNGTAVTLTPVNLERLDPGYYPVYEYLVDNRGRLIFANDLSPFGDTPAAITVDYESLEINPRLLIEYTRGATNELSSGTPVLDNYTLLMNSRQ